MDGLSVHEQKRTALWAVLLPVDRGEGSLRGVMLLAEVQLTHTLHLVADGLQVAGTAVGIPSRIFVRLMVMSLTVLASLVSAA